MSPYSDRKSTRLNSSHTLISYAVFCLKKKKKPSTNRRCTAVYHRATVSTARQHSTHIDPPADHAASHCRLLHVCFLFFFFFFNDTATTEIYPLSLHDALPI